MKKSKGKAKFISQIDALIIRDSLSGQEKKVNLIKGKILNLYLCGPTVYNDVHIGNLRSVFFFDLIIRTLGRKGIECKYVQNITDIDDKIVERSLKEGRKESLITNYYVNEYKKVLERSNIINPDFHLVTDNIEAITRFIKKIAKNDSAYLEENTLLFDINKNSEEYGKLSKQIINNISRENGREINEQKKRNQEDFALWKKTEVGVSWDNEWFAGRPGWHSECAAIIDEVFKGKTIDIHGGGKDLLFPHHENERIQYIAANDRELSRTWIHFGFVLSQKAKMSKSEGNYWTAKDFIDEYNGNILKMLLLDSRYYEDIEVSEKTIIQAASKVKKIENVMKKISFFCCFNQIEEEFADGKKEDIINFLLNELQTTKALSLIEEIISFINKNIEKKDEKKEIELAIGNLLFGLETMGFDFRIKEYDSRTKIKLENWKKLLKNGRYKEADSLRKILQEEGII